MKEITVDSYSIPAKSRSKNYYGSSTVVKSGGSGSSGTSGTTVPTAAVIPDTDWAKILRKDQADTTNYTVDFKAGILLNSKAVTSLLDSTTTDVGTDKALYSSARVDLLISNLVKTYIRKDQDDTTDHSLTVNGTLTAKTLVAQDATVTGHLTTADITASGMITANAGVTATTLTTTGLATLATVDVQGQATMEATMCSPDWASRTKGWGVTRAGAADFRNIYADELRVLAFTADISQALAGSDYLTKSVSKLSANFVVPAAGSSVRIIVDDLEGFPATQCFANGDYVRFRAFDRSAGLVIADVWGTVSLDTTYGNSGYSNGTQAYTFSCTKTSGAGLTLYKGSEVLDYGVSGDGLIRRTVLDTAGSPYTQIETFTGSPDTASNYTTRVRLGNLSGLTNCSGYGLYTGRAFLTQSVLIGDLTKTGGYIEYDGTTLTVQGVLKVTGGKTLASTDDVATAKSEAIDVAYIYGNNALDSAKTYVDGKGYTTSSDVDSRISGKGYTTTADVNTLISGKGFATSTSVKSNLDSIGAQLGYTDYADFVAASELNTTLINGGYINTTLIDTDALVARTAFIASLKSLLITADNINAVAINANSITAGKLSVDRIDTTSITALGAVTAGSFNIGSGKFVVDAGGYLTATGANLTGTVTATNGVIGGLTISSTIPNISTSPLSSTASYTGYLTPQGIGVYHSYGDNFRYVAVTINDNPDTINVVTTSNTGHGIIETSVWGLPSSKAAVVANVHPSDSNYDEAGIGFATNGGVVANRFQTLGGAQLLQLLAYGTVTGTSSGATLSDTYCMTGSISVSRSGEGVYTVTGLNMSDSNYFHRVIAYGTTNNMKVTVHDETWNHFTAEVSDDDSTNDSDFRFMVVGYRKY